MRTAAMTSTVVVTDLDGTTAFDGKPPVPEIMGTLEALARTPGIRLVVATSRSPRSPHDWFGAFGAGIDLICCNGALIIGNGEEVGRLALPPALLGGMIAELRAAGEDFCLEYGDHFVASRADALPWMGVRHRRVLARSESPDLEGVLKLSITRADPWAPRFHDLAGARAEVYPHLTGDADIVAAGATKALGLRRLLRAVPVAVPGAAPVVAAFGNDANDLDLLRGASRAVVVGDGLPGLERLAHVTRIQAESALIAATLRSELARAESAARPFYEPVGV